MPRMPSLLNAFSIHATETFPRLLRLLAAYVPKYWIIKVTPWKLKKQLVIDPEAQTIVSLIAAASQLELSTQSLIGRPPYR